MKPICYLDLDDTILMANSGVKRRFFGPYSAAPGAGEFVLWLLDHFEVRWLTAWAANGVMHPDRLAALATELRIDPVRLAEVKGVCWAFGHKSDGINWEEVRAGRPFIWIEDELQAGELMLLAGNGVLDSYIKCNVTRDPEMLKRVHEQLKLRFDKAAA